MIRAMPKASARDTWLFWLVALLVLGAGLGLRDPWPADEPRFALVARQMVESGQWRRRYEAQAAPGESWEQWTANIAKSKNILIGRLGKPEEAESAIFYLATPQSSYTTGSHIDVSGGVARHV